MPSRKTLFQSILLIIILGALTYGPWLKNEFRIDDGDYFNSDIRNQFTTVISFFSVTPPHDQHYHPFNYLLNIPLFGSLPHDPFGFRIFSLILFTFHCLLLYGFSLLITKNNLGALLASCIFILHPMNSELAGQISLNIILLGSIFMQLSLIFFWLFLEKPNDKKYFYFSIILFIITLFCFEFGFLLPLYLCAMIFTLRKCSFRDMVQYLLPYIMASMGLFILWSSMAGHRAQIIDKFIGLQVTIPGYLASLSALLCWYFQGIFSGESIVFLYSLSPLKTNIFFWNLLWIISAVGISILIKYRWQKSFKSFAAYYFIIGLILLLPASVGHAEVGFVIEPHWLYFSSAGLAFLLAEFLLFLKNKVRVNIWRLLVCCLFVFYFIQTQVILSIGKTAKGYYEHWLEVSPDNYFAYLSLVNIYNQEKNDAQLLNLSEKAYNVGGKKNYYLICNIGSLWEDFHRRDLAKKYLNEAIALSPQLPSAYQLLGNIYLKENQLIPAINYFNSALTADPTHTSSRLSLASTLTKTGQLSSAIATLKDGLHYTVIENELNDIKKKLILLYLLTDDNASALNIVDELIIKDTSAQNFINLTRYFADKKAFNLALAILNGGLKIHSQDKELNSLKEDLDKILNIPNTAH